MTVLTTTNTVAYTGNGSTTEFDFDFLIPTGALVVTVTEDDTVTTVDESDYTASGLDDADGGSVTFDTAPDDGVTVTITRSVDITQEMALVTGGALYAESLEEAYDKLTMIAQQHSSSLNGAIRLPAAEGTVDPLPLAASRAGLVLGFDATGDPTLVDSSSGVSLADNVFYGDEISASISVSGFLDRQGLWVDDADGIQQAADYVSSLEKNDRIQIAPRKTITLTDAITLDASQTLLDGHGSVLDASALTSGAAITWTGSMINQNYRGWRGIRDLRLEGPGYSSGVTGVNFQNIDYADAVAAAEESGETVSGTYYPIAHLRNDGVVINNFGVGESYADKAYLISSYDCIVFNCETGVQIVDGTDCGENLRRFGGGINQCGTAVVMSNGSADLYLHGVSFDFNTVALFTVTGGQICMMGGHVESDDFSDTPISLAQYPNGVRLYGVSLTTKNSASYDYFVDVAEGATALFDGCYHNLAGGTGSAYFGAGDGHLVVRNPAMLETNSNPCRLNASQSAIADGGFESSSLVDLTWISGDTADVVSRTSGANLLAELSTDYSYAGDQSLCLTKTYGSGSIANYVLASASALPGQRSGGHFYYRDPGSGAGKMTVTLSWARIASFDANAIPIIAKSSDIDTSTITFSDTAGEWTQVALGKAQTAAPSWATHVILTVNLFYLDGSLGLPVYFDGAFMSVWG